MFTNPTFCCCSFSLPQPLLFNNSHRRSFLILPSLLIRHSFFRVFDLRFHTLFPAVQQRLKKSTKETRRGTACLTGTGIDKKSDSVNDTQRLRHNADIHLPFGCGCSFQFGLSDCLPRLQLWKHLHKRCCQGTNRFRGRVHGCTEFSWDLGSFHQC